ncbi:MAG TPA: 1-(5-phosphoribosyl)-5-[(5-phosphoribosylamino)methylideneamino]imidazole-4-carboxamide isomerase [Armatimonadota bacterium]|nr:1-(5-phosphoribosyl)-5-[(5-phosphoribosylamino)methylideneamino]imidazole-4-carboxamide isomerase [Armatimonadota bacterium]
MQVIPAVDIRGGRCVRLLQGRFDQETVYADDPVEMAVHWALLGASRLHVVDLDGARTGQPQNVEVIARIVRALEIPVQVGGGIRSLEAAGRMLDLGPDRVIIGTSAALDRELAESMFQAFGEQIALGLDARDGLVAIHGWQETLDLKAVDFARDMEALGARRIIHTDIGRDGMLAGVNFAAMEEMVKAVSIPVIASGGVRSIDDIRSLKRLEPHGLEGVITGKAIYTGSLDLQEAIAAAGG